MRRWHPPPLIRASYWLHAAAGCGLLALPDSWPWWLGGVAANHATLTFAGMVPRSALLGPNLTRLPPGARQIALTFDDGPDPDVTPRVLDLLDAAGARASFFMIGARGARHPDLVRAVLRRGHSVENHTQTHPLHFAALGPGGMRREVLAAQDTLAQAGGVAPGFFRPPVGLRSPFLDPVLARAGLRLATWSRRGADGAIGDAAKILRRLDAPGAGEIFLLHDGNGRPGADGRPAVLAVLPLLLERLAASGLSCVTLPAALDALPLPARVAPPAPAATATAAGSPASGGYASH